MYLKKCSNDLPLLCFIVYIGLYFFSICYNAVLLLFISVNLVRTFLLHIHISIAFSGIYILNADCSRIVVKNKTLCTYGPTKFFLVSKSKAPFLINILFPTKVFSP